MFMIAKFEQVDRPTKASQHLWVRLRILQLTQVKVLTSQTEESKL